MTAEEPHELSRAKVVEMHQSKKPGRQILQMVPQEFKKVQHTIPVLWGLMCSIAFKWKMWATGSSPPVGFSSLLWHCKHAYTLWPCKIFMFTQVTAGLVLQCWRLQTGLIINSCFCFSLKGKSFWFIALVATEYYHWKGSHPSCLGPISQSLSFLQYMFVYQCGSRLLDKICRPLV